MIIMFNDLLLVLSKYDLEAVVQKHCSFKNDKTFLTNELLVSW